MQGQWKDTKYNFVKDKRRAFRRTKDGSNGMKEKAITLGYHTYEDVFGNDRFYLDKFYGYKIGRDIPWKMFFNETLHRHRISRRKAAQKIINSIDRRIVRDYINKGNFNVEVPTHTYSRSIEYMIH